MSELEDRIKRYISEDKCSCTTLSTHFEKLDAMEKKVPHQLDQIIEVLKALAEQNRLKIINLLSLSPLCACELEYILDVSQPTVTYHLQILRKAGLIVMEREGKWTSIKLTDQNIMSLINRIANLT